MTDSYLKTHIIDMALSIVRENLEEKKRAAQEDYYTKKEFAREGNKTPPQYPVSPEIQVSEVLRVANDLEVFFENAVDEGWNPFPLKKE